MEQIVIRHFYDRPDEDQILVTFGLGIVYRRGRPPDLRQPVPVHAAAELGGGITSLGFMIYPTYRLAVVGIVALALLALYLVLYRSRLGMIVRAGIEDSVMVDSLGINVHAGLHDRVRHRRDGGRASPASSTCRSPRSRPI